MKPWVIEFGVLIAGTLVLAWLDAPWYVYILIILLAVYLGYTRWARKPKLVTVASRTKQELMEDYLFFKAQGMDELTEEARRELAKRGVTVD